MSIIVPVYGVEKYIENCILSIIGQTYRDFEAVFVDDGSQDGSAAIVERYAEKDPRIRLIRHKGNRGLFQARITGIDNSEGEYITFIDSDDSISGNWIETLVGRMDDSKADVVIGDFALDIGDEKSVFVHDPIRNQDFEKMGDDGLRFIVKQKGYFFGWTFVWNKMYRREVWDKVLPSLKAFSANAGRIVMCEDIAFTSAVFSVSKKVVNVHGANYYYRFNEGSSTDKMQMAMRFGRNANDTCKVFEYVKLKMIEHGLAEEYESDYNVWLYRYGNKLRSTLKHVACTDSEREDFLEYLEENFGIDKEWSTMLDIFPYSDRVPLEE